MKKYFNGLVITLGLTFSFSALAQKRSESSALLFIQLKNECTNPEVDEPTPFSNKEQYTELRNLLDDIESLATDVPNRMLAADFAEKKIEGLFYQYWKSLFLSLSSENEAEKLALYMLDQEGMGNRSFDDYRNLSMQKEADKNDHLAIDLLGPFAGPFIRDFVEGPFNYLNNLRSVHFDALSRAEQDRKQDEVDNFVTLRAFRKVFALPSMLSKIRDIYEDPNDERSNEFTRRVLRNQQLIDVLRVCMRRKLLNSFSEEIDREEEELRQFQESSLRRMNPNTSGSPL